VKITYYGYNALLIEGDGKTVVVDPGRDLHWRRLGPLVTRVVWSRTDLILVTHGDADHAEYVVPLAGASGAPVVCGPPLARKWERKGLAVVPVSAGETVEVCGVRIRGIRAQHGGLVLKMFGSSLTFKPRTVGLGAIGLLFTLEGCSLLNLGDTLLLEDEWRNLDVDVLMVPIGGMMTMDVSEALRAVAAIQPAVVIPVHHNWDILFYHRPADVERFASGVIKMGHQCLPLRPGQSAQV
jgi:L-ascorbate metabolism protein UlaG (beta-lactamase superfamily)